MPIYTILGGTGSTGTAIIKALTASSSSTSPTSQTSSPTIRIYVRSKTRLLAKLPHLETHPNTTIHEGTLTNTTALSKALHNASIIFSCIATNASEPTTNIALEAASSIIFTLSNLRTSALSNGEIYTPPTVIVLSSMSVSQTMTFKASPASRAIAHTALYYLYSDLSRAQALYRDLELRDPGLLKAIFVQPPGILPGERPTGYRLSTSEGGGVVSFADLGLAMVEVAERSGEFVVSGDGDGNGKGEVTVWSTGRVEPNWGDNLRALRYGFFTSFFPMAWGIGRGAGWW